MTSEPRVFLALVLRDEGKVRGIRVDVALPLRDAQTLDRETLYRRYFEPVLANVLEQIIKGLA